MHYTYLGGILRTRATILRPVVVGLLGDDYRWRERERDLNVWNESKLGNSSSVGISLIKTLSEMSLDIDTAALS